jgi:hypothetical protein
MDVVWYWGLAPAGFILGWGWGATIRNAPGIGQSGCREEDAFSGLFDAFLTALFDGTHVVANESQYKPAQTHDNDAHTPGLKQACAL